MIFPQLNYIYLVYSSVAGGCVLCGVVVAVVVVFVVVVVMDKDEALPDFSRRYFTTTSIIVFREPLLSCTFTL